MDRRSVKVFVYWVWTTNIAAQLANTSEAGPLPCWPCPGQTREGGGVTEVALAPTREGIWVAEFSSYTQVYLVIHDSGSVLDWGIFSPRGTSPQLRKLLSIYKKETTGSAGGEAGAKVPNL